MNQYLLAEENRVALEAHNETLVVTTTKQVGKASYVSYDAQELTVALDDLLEDNDLLAAITEARP